MKLFVDAIKIAILHLFLTLRWLIRRRRKKEEACKDHFQARMKTLTSHKDLVRILEGLFKALLNLLRGLLKKVLRFDIGQSTADVDEV